MRILSALDRPSEYDKTDDKTNSNQYLPRVHRTVQGFVISLITSLYSGHTGANLILSTHETLEENCHNQSPVGYTTHHRSHPCTDAHYTQKIEVR
jgi:hypothetical protein